MRLEKAEDCRHGKGKPNTMEVRTNETTKERRNRQGRNKWVRHTKKKIRWLEQLMVDGA